MNTPHTNVRTNKLRIHVHTRMYVHIDRQLLLTNGRLTDIIL